MLAHGTLKLISPLLHGVIDRRFANLTAATQIVGERVTRDPEGLYREMQTWPDIRPEQLEAVSPRVPGGAGNAMTDDEPAAAVLFRVRRGRRCRSTSAPCSAAVLAA